MRPAIAAAIGRVFDSQNHGEPISYQPRGQAARSIRGIREQAGAEVPAGFDNTEIGKSVTVFFVQIADLEGLDLDNLVGDTLTAGSETWRVSDVDNDGYQAFLTVDK